MNILRTIAATVAIVVAGFLADATNDVQATAKSNVCTLGACLDTNCNGPGCHCDSNPVSTCKHPILGGLQDRKCQALGDE
jgi:hypothetical protein